MSDTRPPVDLVFGSFEVAATVTPAGGIPVSTPVVKLAPRAVAVGEGLVVNEQRDVIAIRRAAVPVLPRESTILIGAKTWIVDGIAYQDDEVVEAFVVAV